ncbi:unnamed protein product [Prorocentrum cordatum]|uniref:Uncharacterized protein n=1 Tax=Prorocentrum cordatum TaxID=2364126 RepID=A0ABN9SJF8_9DINO|nr:unnamed protein product [Polarella glacialis]
MDIDHMVNEVVAMLLGQFGATIAEVVRHAAEVNATDALNELVRSRAAEAARLPCPGPLADHTAPELGGFASAASRPLLGLGLLGLALCAAGGLARRLCCLAPPRGEGKAGSAPPHGREGERARGSAAPRRSDGASAAPPRRSDGAGSSFFGEGARGSAAVQEVELAVAPARQEGASQDPGISFSASANERAGDVRAEAAEAQPSWDCLALHPSVSRMMLVSFPLLIAGNILLMVESNSGVGTSVLISIRANDEQVVRLPSLKDFTLMGSIEDMWNGGAYPLAVLIAFFSGVWPYVKLLTMLLCWLAPTSVLSVHGRQTALEWLDFLGKWSMVDAFVMVLFMVAFKFDLSIAGQAPQVISDVFDEFGGSARLLVYVQPLWGFFLFIGATIGSMVLGHLMTMVHRRAHKVAEFGIRRDSLGRRSRLCDVNRPSGHAGRNFVITPVFFLGVSLLLVVVGLNVNAFQFRFLGLAGFALGEAGSVRPFSVVSLASAVPSANLHSGGPDMFFIQWIFCIQLPAVIIYHVTLMMLWITPLTNRMQRIGLVAAQVMNAWNALDVFVVSICAGVLEIRQLALFIIGTKCDALDAIVEQFPPIVARVPGAVDGRVHCFDVQSELKEGFFVLLAAVLVSTVVGHLVLHRCSVALACDGEDQCTPPTMVEGSCVEDDLDASFRMVFDRGSLQGPPIVGGVA